MKFFKRVRFTALPLVLLLILIMIATTMTFAAEATVNLGSTSDFAILAGSAITNTGDTVINGSAGGNVGLYPGTAFTGEASATISGTVHLADSVAGLAKDDLVIAYDDAVARLPVTRIPTELGGSTLTPGVYDSADGTFQITGTLTLDAQGDPDGVFIFKTASTLITASDSEVILMDDARYCRTFWSVGTSATLGTNSHFVGHIFAMSSITATTGATIQGQLLARNGAVTLDSNTITNGVCDAVVITPVEEDTTVITPVEEDTTVITPVEEDTTVITPVEEDTTVITPVEEDTIVITPVEEDTTVITPVEEDTTVITPVEETVTEIGQELPTTNSNLYNYFLIGVVLLLLGTLGFINSKKNA